MERLAAGQGTKGQKNWTCRKSDQGRTKVNKGDMHQEREREKSGRGSVEMKRREGAWREREILTHGRIRSRMQWRKNEKNSFTGAGQRHLQSF